VKTGGEQEKEKANGEDGKKTPHRATR